MLESVKSFQSGRIELDGIYYVEAAASMQNITCEE